MPDFSVVGGTERERAAMSAEGLHPDSGYLKGTNDVDERRDPDVKRRRIEAHRRARARLARRCVIDGCREVPTVHVPGYPDCVDCCATHDAQLRGSDDDFARQQAAAGCEHIEELERQLDAALGTED